MYVSVDPIWEPLSFLPEKLDSDDGRVEEVDCVLEEDEAVQVRLVGPAVRQEVPDDPRPDMGAQGEEESCVGKQVLIWPAAA